VSGILAALMGSRRNGGPVTNWTTTVQHFLIGAGTATATITLNSDGTTTQEIGASAPTAGPNWYEPTTPGIGSSFTVTASATGSTLTSGTTGSALSLASAQSWSIERAVPGTGETYLNLDIRRLGVNESLGTVVLSISKEL
jgi:hypothetical protein